MLPVPGMIPTNRLFAVLRLGNVRHRNTADFPAQGCSNPAARKSLLPFLQNDAHIRPSGAMSGVWWRMTIA